MQRNKKRRFGGVLVVRTYTKRYPFGWCSFRIAERIFRLAKGKPAERQGRKATGPRFLREATDDASKDPKIAGLPSVTFITGDQQ